MLRLSLHRTVLAALFILAAFPLGAGEANERRARVAILDFGDTQTGTRVAEKLTQVIGSGDREFQVIDPDQTRSAVRGSDYRGSLNMNVEDARDLGAAIDCDFFFTGEAQTLRRSSSDNPVYYESYAVIYLVSARTGKLISWQRASASKATPEDAEKFLLQEVFVLAASSRQTMLSALRDESGERAHAIENGAPVIGVLAEENPVNTSGTHPPRPYRRLKPVYPDIAAQSEIEATVDVLVDVDEKGEVGRVEIARWAGYGLDKSVLNTVKQLHFFPAMRDGVAVPMRVLLRYNFRKPPK
ncbi:MAG TPA: TonB family protein [Pyrinomonadaceae bacterium]